MGFFGGYLFDGTSWSEFDPAEGHTPDIAAPWLSISIFDSDIAIVRYEPPGPGSGIAYFGYTPQAYFGNEPASAPADVAREAAGLASWLTRLQGRTDEAALRELIAPFIADDTQEQLDEDDEDLLDGRITGDLDDADIFVQFKVARFLEAAGLPAPGGLPC